MYSIPPVCNKIHSSNIGEMSTMYTIKPYYSDFKDQQLPSGPLPVPMDIDLVNDHDSRMALEDLLSRQMMLLCRLNDLERTLLEANDIKTLHQEKLIDLKPISQKHEDIVIHFDIDHPPMTLLTVLKVLTKQQPNNILVNYHVHSSLLTDSTLMFKQRNLNSKLSKIDFHFNTVQDNTERGNRPLILTFIAKKQQTQCYGSFKSNQSTVCGELNIVQRVCSMVMENQADQKHEHLWKLLLETDLSSDKECIEKLGQHFVGLDGKNFLLDNKELTMLDVVVWSLANNDENKYRALKSLLDAKWFQVVQSMIKI